MKAKCEMQEKDRELNTEHASHLANTLTLSDPTFWIC